MSNKQMKPDSVNNHWLFLSVYYAKNSWGNLVTEILTIIEDFKKGKKIQNHIILFSHERGENVRLAISSADSHKINELSVLIEERISSFIVNNPSTLDEEFEYGKTLWCNYTNNSLVWNTYDLSRISIVDINLLSKTSAIIFEFLNDDFSSENFYSVSLFLLVQVFKNIKSAKEIATIEKTVNNYSTELSQFKEQYVSTDELVTEFGGRWIEIFELIHSYWNDSDNDNIVDLKEWEDSIKKKIQKGESILTLTYAIFYVLGLNTTERYFLLGLLSKYFRESKLF